MADLVDADVRARIVGDLGATLFVEAGAGSGKTTALVDRVIALVESEIELRSIAAITFTEKAGAELRDRLRQALTARGLTAALDQLDGAAIGTLHAFAQRILTDHAIEARLPPAVEVLDEIASRVEFERRWRTFRDQLLADSALNRTILLLTAAGVRPEAMRVLAVAFNDNWDLVADRVEAESPEPPPVLDVLQPVLAAIDAVCAHRSLCTDPDRLSARLDELAAFAQRLRDAPDEFAALEVAPPSFSPYRGRKAGWTTDMDVVMEEIRTIGPQYAEVYGAVGEACVRRLGAALRAFTLDAAEQRRADGRLEFHDLLVLSRQLLRDHGGTRLRPLGVHRRYERILLDEFQDTDPIQIELAVRIACLVPAADQPWDTIDTEPGRLFFVGDPKQSIYRFRRADPAMFAAARDRFGPPLQLTTNFRTVAPIVDWVNAAFGALMAERFTPLHPARGAGASGPPVAVVGAEAWPKDTSADDMRIREAADVAGAVGAAVGSWSVSDPGTGTWRPARLGDVTILVPSRTSLPFLEDALQQAGIPFRAESSSLVYATRAVRDLLMVLRAAADPTDSLRIVAALRTPLFGCGDDELYRYRVDEQGSWNYLVPPATLFASTGPVADALAYLRGIHDMSRWLSPSELLTRVAVERRAFELGFAEGRPRDVWRRLRFVIDQARAWSDVTGGSLRQYLAWVQQQTAEGARVSEAILPETDDDAVRIMTIHAAKGLEFPVTILSGMSTKPGGQRASAQVVFPPTGKVGYRIGRAVTTDEYEEWKPIDEQLGLEERIRLLYVACTRARDHLVVSLHRKERSSDAQRGMMTNAELLVDAMGGAPPPSLEPATMPAVPAAVLIASPPPFAAWEAERAAALIRPPTTIAATALGHDAAPDPGLQKQPRDLDLPPWLKGRYGTSIGRAVHGVMQTIDLGTGEGIDDLVAAQCEAEAIPQHARTVRALVQHALGSPSVQAAARRRHWREVYACTPVDGRLLEGYIDLLYRDDEGLVVVDYKTAATPDLDRLMDAYRFQGGSYALAVGASTGETVVRVTFVFLTPSGAVERDLTDLDAAVGEVNQLVVLRGT